MRHYEVMVILDPELDERTIAPSLDAFLSVIKKDGGTVEKVDIWGRRRLSFEIKKKAEGIYAVIDISAEPASVIELDRQLNLNESVLRTKVLRPIPQKAKSKKAAAKKRESAAKKSESAAKKIA
ncbi:MAG: 30S ribosomal protein S6 [Jatrophihabitantaceae bacterium]